MARKVLPRFLSIREEGGERIYEGHVFSLKRYRQGMQGKFAGIESYCDAALTVPPGVTSETPHYPTEEQLEACARGAEKFFVALGKIACGTEIEKLGESESRLCELHREAIVAETTQPASFGGYDCPVAGGRQCP